MADTRRILVIANETCAGVAVCEEVRHRAGGLDGEVLVVAPVLAESRIGHWLSDGAGRARQAARVRLEESVAALRTAGLVADGRLGDADPLQALDDAFRTFNPDEILISTHPPARSNWLERKVVERARERYSVPVTHVVVDLAQEAARTHADPRPVPRAPRPAVTLYRAAGYDEALAVQQRGFTNAAEVAGRSGVLMTDAPDALAGVAAPTLFAVEIPADLLESYELDPTDGARRWVLPADLVNRHGPRALVADWSE